MYRIALLLSLPMTLPGCSTLLGVSDVTLVDASLVDAPLVDAPPCQEGFDALRDGGFEDPKLAWVSDPDHSYFCSKPVISPHGGISSGCLGLNADLVETLHQEVSLFGGTKSVTLTGFICIDTDQIDNLEHDVLSVDLLHGENMITRLTTLSNRDGSNVCDFKAFSTAKAQLTGDPGTMTLRFTATQGGPSPRTTFYFDDLKLITGCTP
jgi:hypothetical protein